MPARTIEKPAPTGRDTRGEIAYLSRALKTKAVKFRFGGVRQVCGI